MTHELKPVQDALATLDAFIGVSYRNDNHGVAVHEQLVSAMKTIRATLTHPKPSSAGLAEPDENDWKNYAFCLAERLLDQGTYDWTAKQWFEKMNAALQPQKDNAPIEGLREAIEDHYCASDAILGKNIDILAKAARRYLALTEGTGHE